MTKYEYMVEPVAHNSTPTEGIIDRFNILGAEGWQAIGPFPTPSHVLFVRATGADETHIHMPQGSELHKVGEVMRVRPQRVCAVSTEVPVHSPSGWPGADQ